VDLALSAAKELVMNEKVDILVGTINSAGALAVSEFCKTEKIPFLVTFSKSDKITGEKGHRYVFSITENTAMIGKSGRRGLGQEALRENTGSPATTMNTVMPWPTGYGKISRKSSPTWSCSGNPGIRWESLI